MSARLYFDLVNTYQSIPDREGIEVDDVGQAMAAVAKMLEEHRQEDASTAQEWSGWTLHDLRHHTDGFVNMRACIVATAVLAHIATASAQTRSDRQTMAPLVGDILPGMTKALDGLELLGQNMSVVRSKTPGDARRSVERFDEARRKPVIALRDFVIASRDLRNKYEACS